MSYLRYISKVPVNLVYHNRLKSSPFANPQALCGYIFHNGPQKIKQVLMCG